MIGGSRERKKPGQGMKIILDRIKERGEINKDTIQSIRRIDWTTRGGCPLKQNSFPRVRINLYKLFTRLSKEKLFESKSNAEKYKILSSALFRIEKRGAHSLPKWIAEQKVRK